jgi:methyl-accepting chemotaxis protein
MKNFMSLKIKQKLMLAMMSVAVFVLIVGIFGVAFIDKINKNNMELHEISFMPMSHIAIMYDSLAQQRIASIDIVAYFEYSPDFVDEEVASIGEKDEEFLNALNAYLDINLSDKERELITIVSKQYQNDFRAATADIIDLRDSTDDRAKIVAIKHIDDLGSEISSNLDTLYDLNIKQADTLIADNQKLIRTCIILLTCIFILAMIVATFVSIKLSGLIQKPIAAIQKIMVHIKNTGNLHISDDMKARVDSHIKYNDETSTLARSFKGMMDDLITKVVTLEAVAQGDLSTKVELSGEEDTLGIAINAMITNLSAIVSEVRQSSQQLAASTAQLSIGAQNLAMSSSEQSASVEQLHFTAKEVAVEAEENARRAIDASALTQSISASAFDGSKHMYNMNLAMDQISEASHSVKSVIKSIEDIAFQTNILSLNAAVEAARAGAQGKGFAVVADEVRVLATKSSEAVNDSDTLINDTIEKADQGSETVVKALEFFKTIEEGISSTSNLLTEIAKAAENQRLAIEKINKNIAEFNDVVFHNSSTAEESAAASDQMTAHTANLNDLVDKFKL